jgi:hypothetical protein
MPKTTHHGANPMRRSKLANRGFGVPVVEPGMDFQKGHIQRPVIHRRAMGTGEDARPTSQDQHFARQGGRRFVCQRGSILKAVETRTSVRPVGRYAQDGE